MNRCPHATVTQLAVEIGVPRSTAYRLLDTLAAMGFVSTLGGRYRLAQAVRTLSDGFVDETWMCPAWTEMLRLSKTLIWPLCLSTPDIANMVIRRTTHELSAMSIDYGMVGRRLPITDTAAGRTYLAFCSDQQREMILAILAEEEELSDRLSRDLLEERLVRIRAQGFDTRIGGYVGKTGTLAVPLIAGDRVLGCLGVIFIAAGLSVERAIAQFEAPLKAAAATIRDAVLARAEPTMA